MKIAVLLSIMALSASHSFAEDLSDQKFEVWGVSTSAYQIEGAWNVDGKGESIWDHFTHSRQMENGDMACSEYYSFHSTVDLLKDLGVTSYRFSIAWTRIQPDGTGEPNKKGLAYYRNLINELKKAGIDPMVTIYHWDLPQAIEDKGGWTNRETVSHYVEYANILFREFGNEVTYWVTHNEPRVTSQRGYGSLGMAPGRNDPTLIPVVDHHLLLSHGLAVKAYRELGLKGQIGISLNLKPIYSLDDKNVGEVIKQDVVKNRNYLNPILLGAYPEVVQADYILENDMHVISEPIDFLGVNYYSRQVVSPENYTPTAVNSLGWETYPLGLYDLLISLRNTYPILPPVIITENGYSDELNTPIIIDNDRMEYIDSHVKAVKKAKKDGVPIKGYFVWSLYDNFEWSFGYSPRFGLVHVDFKTLIKRPKGSFYLYKEIIKNSKLSVN